MKPYGLRRLECAEDIGPPTKKGKVSSKKRRTSRRLLHKQGRHDAKQEIHKQGKDGS